ncbi:hypothetical protein MHEL_50490 [Mycolicibacterium helvum]|uniref:Integrase n=1 Tax=Mycolicibacterium helvum TaxID=1534349 RepID=A0A7I7TF68_9MYCO|nr:hypothetical protein MHEL_50490 [Mycolicibacterium helvum]
MDDAHSKVSERWLTALRDSTAFKIGYAFGLRRRELVMLDLTDFAPNPHVPRYGNFGAMTVRWAKDTKGSGPRRRTVLTSPEFPWVVDLLQYWCSEGRELFATADRSPAGSLKTHSGGRSPATDADATTSWSPTSPTNRSVVTCYQAAKRITGICACGHQGVLPGIIHNRPACRRCSGVTINVDCVSCGDLMPGRESGLAQALIELAPLKHAPVPVKLFF